VSSVEANKRRVSRTKAVLPVRIKGKDSSGKAFEELAHTLDVTQSGVRLGSVRRELKAKDEVTIFFRQRKMQFRVVWTKRMNGTSEFQVGLQALEQEKEAWGVAFADQAQQPSQPLSASLASALA
jgi:PilZ domain-containing protein